MEKTESQMEKKIGRFTYAEVAAFLAALALGMIVYLPWAVNMLQSADGAYVDVVSLWYWDTSLGRWLIGPDQFLRNSLTLPLYTTAISILMLSLTALLWVRMFQIRGGALGSLVGALIILYPCTANSMLLFYFQHMYFGSTFLATLAVYSVKSTKSFFGAALGAALLCCSLGCYQPGICIAATLALFCMIRLSAQAHTAREIGKELLRYLVMGAGGCILYVPVTNLIWRAYGMSPATYGGIDGLGSLNVKLLLPCAIQSYWNGVRLYFTDVVFDNTSWNLHLLFAGILMATAALIVVSVAKGKLQMNSLLWKIGLPLFLLLPVCLAMIELIVPSRNINYVMSMQYVLPIVACLKVVDTLSVSPSSAKAERRVGVVAICFSILLCNAYWMYDSAIGVALEMARNKAVSFANRIVYRMEETDGYEPGMNVLICGQETTENYPRIYPELYDTVTSSSASYGYIWGSIPLEQRGWNELFQSLCGIKYQIPGQDVTEHIMASEEYRDMPAYPAKGSARVIEEVMVVKLSDDP